MWLFIGLACLLADVSAFIFAFFPAFPANYALLPASAGILVLQLGMIQCRDWPRMWRPLTFVSLVGIGLAFLLYPSIPALMRMLPFVMACVGVALFQRPGDPAALRVSQFVAGMSSAVFLVFFFCTSMEGDSLMVFLWVALAAFLVAWRLDHRDRPESTDWFVLTTVLAHMTQAFLLFVPETPLPGTAIAYVLVLYYTAVQLFIWLEFWVSTRMRSEDDDDDVMGVLK